MADRRRSRRRGKASNDKASPPPRNGRGIEPEALRNALPPLGPARAPRDKGGERDPRRPPPSARPQEGPRGAPARGQAETRRDRAGAERSHAEGRRGAIEETRRPRLQPTDDAPGSVQAIPLESIDPHAVEVLRRLRRFGFKAYLVGGCVRDLLLGLEPKDFDIATDARPEEVKNLFRNSRIIGRRFRLVHLYFRGGKILEVATFRANVIATEEDGEDQDLLIRRDNVFGSEEEDALRRDFTINGLFYDIMSGQIIDHVNGMADIRARCLRMIGDPDIRLREDPVRILRAIRLTAKTGTNLDPELREALTRHKKEIGRCAPARVLEEALRLLRIGHAERTVRTMMEVGVLDELLPEIAAYIRRGEEDGRTAMLLAHLRALDELIKRKPVTDAVVLASLVCGPVSAAQQAAELKGHDRGRATQEMLALVGGPLTLTRRLSEQMRQIFLLQKHFGQSDGGKNNRRRRTPPTVLLRRAIFAEALDLREIHSRAHGLPLDEIEQWRSRASGVPDPAGMANASSTDRRDEDPAPRRRRRRRA